MNLGQYALMVLLPLAFANNFIDTLVPKVNESTGNIEILIEVVGHTLLLLGAVFLVDRVVNYLPTYSGKELNSLNLATLVIVFIMLTQKTKQKMDLLFRRLLNKWNGEEEQPKKKVSGKGGPVQQKPQVSVSQPITGMPKPISTAPTSTPDYMQHHKVMTPQPEISMGIQANPGAQNGLYNNAGMEGMQGMMQEPMAANDGFGAFSSF